MIIKKSTAVCLVLVSLLSSMALQAETSLSLSENLKQLDQRYRALSFELYQHYVDPDGGGMGTISGPMRLETLVGPMQL